MMTSGVRTVSIQSPQLFPTRIEGVAAPVAERRRAAGGDDQAVVLAGSGSGGRRQSSCRDRKETCPDRGGQDAGHTDSPARRVARTEIPRNLQPLRRMRESL